MKTEYVVCDWEGNVSCDKSGQPETFAKFRGAEARSRELAEETPGCFIRIYELTAETIVPTAGAETSRKHPTEHYK